MKNKTLLGTFLALFGGMLLGIIFKPRNYDYKPTAMGYFGIAFVVIVGNVIAFSAYMMRSKSGRPSQRRTARFL